MISAEKARHIAKYENPQAELVEIVVEQLIDYIDKRTIAVSQSGLFEDSLNIKPNVLPLCHFKMSDKISKRSVKEVIEKVADILEEQGYSTYYEEGYLWWCWNKDE